MDKKRKSLIVIMNDFPYNIGEPFFETELPFLLGKFESITIFSVNGRKREKQTRDYDSSVKCVPLGIGHSRILNTIVGLFANNKTFRFHEKGKKMLAEAYLLGKNTRIFAKIKKYFKKNDAKMTECIIYTYWLTLGIASYKLKNHLYSSMNIKCKIVSRCHGYDLYSEVAKFSFQPFQYDVIKSCDFICPCSNFGATYLSSKYPEFSDKIITKKLGSLYHGIRKSVPNKNNIVLVTCSGLRPVKRLTFFAETFSLLTHLNDKVYWLCIGDGTEKGKIIDILKRNNTSNKVKMIGNLENKAIFDLYRNEECFCLVNVSESEGIPMSIMEAFSFGIPTIATNVGGNNEIVNNENGLLIPKDISTTELASIMNSFVSMNKKDYVSMCDNAKKTWKEQYDAEKNYLEWTNFLLTQLN